MGFIKKIFGSLGVQKPKSVLEVLQQLGTPIITGRFRDLAEANNNALSKKTTDKKIMEIYQRVGTAFQREANNRGETIPSENLNGIIFKFVLLYDKFGEVLFNEHLEYEIEKYHREGLRQDYLNFKINLVDII